jgi:hypothetical protein
MRRRQAACASGPGHAECPDRYAPSAQPSHRVAAHSGGCARVLSKASITLRNRGVVERCWYVTTARLHDA